MQDRSLCEQLDFPGHLLLALSVDLERLENVGSDVRALDRSEAALQVVFELSDGSYAVWPSLSAVEGAGLLPDDSADAGFSAQEEQV